MQGSGRWQIQGPDSHHTHVRKELIFPEAHHQRTPVNTRVSFGSFSALEFSVALISLEVKAIILLPPAPTPKESHEHSGGFTSMPSPPLTPLCSLCSCHPVFTPGPLHRRLPLPGMFLPTSHWMPSLSPPLWLGLHITFSVPPSPTACFKSYLHFPLPSLPPTLANYLLQFIIVISDLIFHVPNPMSAP